MKVLLTSPAYLHEDMRFERHIYKSIVFYCNMNAFFICIFAMVLRHVQIIVKMYDYLSFYH